MIAALNVFRKEMGKLKAAGISVGYFDELEHFVTNIAEKDEGSKTHTEPVCPSRDLAPE